MSAVWVRVFSSVAKRDETEQPYDDHAMFPLIHDDAA